jgi:hypothetical protein
MGQKIRFLASLTPSTMGSELTGPLLDSISSGFLGGRSLMRGSDDGTAGVDSGASICMFNSLVVTLDFACNPAVSDFGRKLVMT